MKVYYAHAVTDYGTPREAETIAAIERLGWEVVNPDDFFVEEDYKAQGMNYFKPFVQDCPVLVFTPFPNGFIGAGVAKEIEWALERDAAVYEYNFIGGGFSTRIDKLPSYVLSVEDTKKLIKELRNADKAE